MWNTQTRLELDAVHMAAAGVEFLPGAPARATLAAAHSAALCGLSPSEVVRAAAALDGMSFNVTVRGTAPVLLLRLLGVAGVNVTALATAKVHPSATPRKSGGPMVLSDGRSDCLSAWPVGTARARAARPDPPVVGSRPSAML